MSNPYLNHLLDRVQSDLTFLSQQNLLSASDVQLIKSKLDSIPRTGTSNGLESSISTLQISPDQQQQQSQQQYGGGGGGGTGASSVSTSKGQCKAVWNYTKSQPDDLGFRQGDIIDIVEQVNQDWWKGSLHGETGLFPSNHVELIENSANRAPPPPPPQQNNAGTYNSGYSQPQNPSSFSPPPPPSHYGVPPAPAPNAQYAYQQPQNYSSGNSEKQQFYQPPPPPNHQYSNPPPPPPQHYAVPPPPPNVTVASNMTEEEKKKSKFPGGGKFGKQMGTAFAGGMGFGAGSAITSNAINAIF